MSYYLFLITLFPNINDILIIVNIGLVIKTCFFDIFYSIIEENILKNI